MMFLVFDDDDDDDGVNDVLGLHDDDDDADDDDVLGVNGDGGDSGVNDDNDDNDDGLAGVVAEPHVLPHRAYGFLFTTIHGHPDVTIIHPNPQLFDQLGQQPPVLPLRNTRLS